METVPRNDDQEPKAARVFLWCTPRTVSTAFTKCLSFIEGIEVWFEPFIYCFLSGKEAKNNLGVDLPMELEGNEEIFTATTDLMRRMTGANVIHERIVYANVKASLESTTAKYVFVKDISLAFRPENTRRYFPQGYRHTFLIRTPARTIPSFREAYFRHFLSQGLLTGEAADEKTFDLLRDCKHMDSGYNIEEQYELWKYVRQEIDPNPIVIDTDDLLNNPREMMRKYCQLVGLPFSESLMQWDASLDIFKTWKKSGDNLMVMVEPFYGRAMHSSCFKPPSKAMTRDQMTPDVIKGVDETMEHYEEMYQHRIKI